MQCNSGSEFSLISGFREFGILI